MALRPYVRDGFALIISIKQTTFVTIRASPEVESGAVARRHGVGMWSKCASTAVNGYRVDHPPSAKFLGFKHLVLTARPIQVHEGYTREATLEGYEAPSIWFAHGPPPHFCCAIGGRVLLSCSQRVSTMRFKASIQNINTFTSTYFY